MIMVYPVSWRIWSDSKYLGQITPNQTLVQCKNSLKVKQVWIQFL